ncbi:hypothetical protein DID73_01525 [Candidatus Marinamargulisbacteria bacterium SCGC AG-343-K17]|nr:hypothetical protein DID73_01525 [Candidatus Marinamargulisbacteria bacterium SCGC AG-343-K17]
MANKKVKLNKGESENLMPIIREFNKIAGAVNALLGQRVESKERKISVMVSRIKRPDEKTSQIKVKTVEFTKGFLKKQKKKKKGDDQSEWDDGFTEKRGFII